jgi:hypothetical protein
LKFKRRELEIENALNNNNKKISRKQCKPCVENHFVIFLSAAMNLSKSLFLVWRPRVMRKEEEAHSGLPSASMT